MVSPSGSLLFSRITSDERDCQKPKDNKMNVAISCTGMSSGSFVLTAYNTQRLSSVLNENFFLCVWKKF